MGRPVSSNNRNSVRNVRKAVIVLFFVVLLGGLFWWLKAPRLQCRVLLVELTNDISHGPSAKFSIANTGKQAIRYDILDIQVRSNGVWSSINRQIGAVPVWPVLNVNETVEFDIAYPTHGDVFIVPIDYEPAKLTGTGRIWGVLRANYYSNLIRLKHGKGPLWRRFRFMNRPWYFPKTCYSPQLSTGDTDLNP